MSGAELLNVRKSVRIVSSTTERKPRQRRTFSMKLAEIDKQIARYADRIARLRESRAWMVKEQERLIEKMRAELGPETKFEPEA